MNINLVFEKALSLMKEKEYDCLILTPSTDLRYMTGFHGLALERPVFLILTKDEAYFVLPEFEIDNIGKAIRESAVCIPWKEEENPYEKVRQCMRGIKIKTASFGNNMCADMFYHLQQVFPQWEWEPSGQIMSALRAKKTEEEYLCLKEAQRLSGQALLKLIEKGISGKTELEAGKELKTYMEQEGLICSGVPLVAAGKNGALPHHAADNTVIQKGDSVIFDFGGTYNGYFSDITRTVIVEKAPDEFKEIYQIVREANETSAAVSRPGITGAELDAVARNVIRKAGYGQYFTHRLGHGIGLDVHEEPYISSNNRMPLQSGNVFSNEPGIYLPGRFGIRLEDVLFLRDDSTECLTELTHEILITD